MGARYSCSSTELDGLFLTEARGENRYLLVREELQVFRAMPGQPYRSIHRPASPATSPH